MVESELGLIPQGWKMSELGNLAESIRRNMKPGMLSQKLRISVWNTYHENRLRFQIGTLLTQLIVQN